MKKMFHGWALAACTLVLTPFAAQAQKVAVPERMPTDIKAILSVNDTNGMWEAVEKTPVFSQIQLFLDQPSVRANHDLQQLRLSMDKAILELGFSLYPNDFLGKTVKGADLYLVRTSPQAPPNLLAVVKFDSAANAEALAAYIEKEARKQSEDLVVEGAQPIKIDKEEVAGVGITTLPSESLSFGVMGDVFLASSSIPVLKDSITSTGGERIHDVTTLQKYYSKVSDHAGQILLFIDGQEVNALTEMVPEAGAVAANLNAGSFVGVANFTPNQLDLASFVQIPAPSPAMKKLLAIAPVDQSNLMNYVDSSAMFGTTVNGLDGPLFYQAAQEAAVANPGAAMGLQQLDAFGQSVEQQTGLSFKNDVLPAFGPEMVLAVNKLSLGGGMNIQFDTLAVLGIRDETKADNVLRALESNLADMLTQQAKMMDPNATEVKPTEEQYGGVTIRSLGMNNPMIPVQLAFTHAKTADGQLLLGLNTDSVKSALDRKNTQTGGVNMNEDWLMVKNQFPSEVNKFASVNFNKVGVLLSDTIPMAMGFMGGGASQEDLGLALQGISILKSLGSFYGTTVNEPDGSLSTMTIVMQ